jgi:hypothetical protein
VEQQNQAILMTELSEQIAACTFSKADLKTLCEKLQESSYEAAEEEMSHYRPLDRPPEQVLADREALGLGFELQVVVQGIGNKVVAGTIPVVFNSPRFPDKVKSLYINTQQNLKDLYNWLPRNHFQLFLDFTKPGIFNLSLSPSGSTPNASSIRVSGLDSTWVNGVYSEVTNFIKRKETRRRFLHRHSVYDVLLICGGFPFAFSIVYKLSGLINSLFGEHSGILKSAAYVYVFYFSLLLFRILFDYARWIFPIVEYKESNGAAQKHRAILVLLVLGVLVNLLYDVFKIVTGLIP